MKTFQIEINEEQRAILIAALQSAKIAAELANDRDDETDILLEMFESDDLVESDDGVNGFCF